MRTVTVDGRMTIVRAGLHVDVEQASQGRFGPDPLRALRRWDEFRRWCDHAQLDGGEQVDERLVDAPVPRPGQVFGIGLNYRGHARESGSPLPDVPLVFTKFPSCVTGPTGAVTLPTTATDWEAELAVVIGRRTRSVSRVSAWSHVAGVTLAQDFSARDVQFTPPDTPQFSLGKSFPGFLPMGPALVTPDELADPDGVRIWCEVDGARRQDASTNDLVFPVPVLIEYLSSIVVLEPGDVILTGTPAGVGAGRTPPLYLSPGQVVVTGSDELGLMRHVMAAPEAPWSWSA